MMPRDNVETRQYRSPLMFATSEPCIRTCKALSLAPSSLRCRLSPSTLIRRCTLVTSPEHLDIRTCRTQIRDLTTTRTRTGTVLHYHFQGFSTLGAGSVVPSVRHRSFLSYLTFLHV